MLTKIISVSRKSKTAAKKCSQRKFQIMMLLCHKTYSERNKLIRFP